MINDIALEEFLVQGGLPSFQELPSITQSNINWADPRIGQAMVRFHTDRSTDQASRGLKSSNLISAWISSIIKENEAPLTLDLFSGLGSLCLELRKEGRIGDYLGVDINPVIVRAANESAQDGADFLCSDVMSYLNKIDRLQFGLIFMMYECLNAIGISNTDRLLRIIASKCKPGTLIAGDIRLHGSVAANFKKVRVLAETGLPCIENADACSYIIDEYGCSMGGKFYGHRYVGVSDSGQIVDSKHCLLELFDKECFIELLIVHGFELISSKQLLRSQATDVPECRDNLFFAAKLMGG